jgi:dihydropteroate synthase
MGVLNRTPDSFSDGGRFLDLSDALKAVERMVLEGADLIDVGGESTRPGADPVDEAEELERVAPLIRALRASSAVRLSIDTRKAAVARAAILAGAQIWNDVSALEGPGSLEAAAELGCDVVLMHAQGDPKTMQKDPRYQDVVGEVLAYLLKRAEAAMAAGVARERIVLDPGLGFGKTAEHNLALLADLAALTGSGFRVLVGASRKRFIQAVDPSARTPQDRLGGSIAAALAAARAGCAVVRTHDVRETAQALRVQEAIQTAGGAGA